MKEKITIPSMGESITEITIGEILISSGSNVEMDDEILEMETDKVNQVLYAPEDGVLNLTVSTGDVVKPGDDIGYVDSDGSASKKEEKEEKPKEDKPKEPKKEPSERPFLKEPNEAPKEEAPKEEAPKEEAPNGESVRVSREDFVKGLGDSPETAKQAPSTPKSAPIPSTGKPETRKRMTSIRKVIAKRLVEAQQTTAMLTTFNEVDMSAVMDLRSRYKETFEKTKGVKLGFMSFFVKAVVEAMKQVPDLNAYIDGDEVVYREYFDIGIAVGTERGLVVPVVRDCEDLGFAEIEGQISDYAKQARDGNLSLDDLQGGGFTITNGGVYGSLLSTPILNLPQSGILGMHKIEKRPIVIDDEIVIRPMMYLALSYDHRIVDGKGAVTFLVKIKEYLEDPARLILEI